MKKRLLFITTIIITLAFLIVGCTPNEEKTVNKEDSGNKENSLGKEEESKKIIKIGTFSTSKIAADSGKKELEDMGYEVEIVVFDDAVLPNTALAEGSIDANIFQHTPYLDAYLKDNDKVSLSMVDPLLYYPNYGLYSIKHKNIENIPENGIIGLYNDASNMDRGLKLLESSGLIKLTDEKKDLYNLLDISENPKNLKFVEMAFGTAVRSLEDTDASIATGSHILQADMDPKSALILEETKNDFACGITVGTEELDKEWVKNIKEAYTSDSARKALEEGYKGASVALY